MLTLHGAANVVARWFVEEAVHLTAHVTRIADSCFDGRITCGQLSLYLTGSPEEDSAKQRQVTDEMITSHDCFWSSLESRWKNFRRYRDEVSAANEKSFPGTGWIRGFSRRRRLSRRDSQPRIERENILVRPTFIVELVKEEMRAAAFDICSSVCLREKARGKRATIKPTNRAPFSHGVGGPVPVLK